MRTHHIAGIAAAAMFALAPATAFAQLEEGPGGPVQTCEQALGPGDVSVIPVPAGELECCYVSAETDWYLEHGVQLGGSYEVLGQPSYTAVECPGTMFPQSLIDDGPDDDDDDDNDDNNNNNEVQ